MSRDGQSVDVDHFSSDVDEDEERAALNTPESHGRSDEPSHHGLTKLLGNPNAATIAGNGAAFGGGIREGLEVEEDDEDVEIDSDIENELPRDDEVAEAEIEQPQKCANWCVLYVFGFLTCLACEFLILLPAFYLRLSIVGTLYGVLWLSFTSCAVHLQVCPGKRKPHSHLAWSLYVAALAAYIGGMAGAYYYKQAWYFDRMDSAYNMVNPHVNPMTGVDTSGLGSAVDTVPGPMDPQPTFLEFKEDLATKRADGQSWPFATFVYKNQPNTTATVVGMVTLDDTTYCAAPLTHTHVTTWTNTAPVMPTIYYWAIGENCCGNKKDGSVDAIWTTCPYWGLNIPTQTQTIEDFSAEVLADRLYGPYRDAVRAWFTLAGIDPMHDGSTDSFLVKVMSLDDHYKNQDERRKTAWIWLFVGAALWPVLMGAHVFGIWLWQQIVAACSKNPQRMQ